MDRRRFLQIAGIAGLSVMAPVGLRDGSAATAKYKGPFWIMVNAGGGWDPTIHCDPKGGKMDDHSTVNQSFTKDQIGHVGEFAYAPTELQVQMGMSSVKAMSAPDFFNKHHKRLLVMNGIDTTTNNHDSGNRTTWSGQTAEGNPAFAALVAGLAVEAIPVPMAFLSYGGYDSTGGIVPLTRVGDINAIEKLAYPNTLNAGDKNARYYHSPDTASRIAAAQSARIQAIRSKQTLPTLRTAMDELFLAREGNEGLGALGEQLRGIQLVKVGDLPGLAGANLGDAERLMQQMQVACLAFKAGVAVSVNVGMGGYDTHSNNDDQQTQQAMQLFLALDYLFGMLDKMGLADQTNVLVGSDFGRTPYYNDGNGKDHWNITSMIMSGPKFPMDRVIGATDDGFKPVTVNQSSLKPDTGGLRIEPKHIHRALRKMAGITGTAIDTQFPILGEDLPLFG